MSDFDSASPRRFRSEDDIDQAAPQFAPAGADDAYDAEAPDTAGSPYAAEDLPRGAFSPTPVPDAAIAVRDLRHRFGNHEALSGVTFSVARQSLHGFVGPNGAGKTTCLKLICTLLEPQSGSVRVFGHDVKRDVRKVRRRIGFMPDHFSMYRQMTVGEYLDFFGAAYGLNLSQRNRVIGDVLELTDMSHRADDLIQGLSRGMQQRVSLARALINDPDLLLLDEPASGLDPRARIELMEILRALRELGKTVFISSHILSELAELCDSVTIIDRGEIRFSGAMEALLEHEGARAMYQVQLVEDVPDLPDRLASVAGIESVERGTGRFTWTVAFDDQRLTTNDVLEAIIHKGGRVAGFQRAKRHLNEAFLALTEEGVR